jgi:uncharacterized membrane protein YGL010W
MAKKGGAVASMVENPYLRLIAREGVVAALLIYIVYWLLTSFSASMTTSAVQHGQMLQVLQQVCANGAKSNADRNACFTIHKDTP